MRTPGAAEQRRSLRGERPEPNGAPFFLPKPKQPQRRGQRIGISGQPRPSAIFGPDKATVWERNGMLVYRKSLKP
ncbi:MAG: hypothetical protein HN494_02265 [Opitutae bacterium]|nr:hypothetical protein [Opitutae bacterium]